MIRLKAIKKIYATDDRKLHALKGITLDMRKSEFVCILGPSGCGKTTLLNIIGGLDRYSSGDLVINGKSTKNFTDEDWDTYRSRKVGFVFQSYNLIPHQTVLENVETALVISGIGREERRKRAIQALVDVGLSEHLRKTPRQLSGGEMQRVAIARAIVNDPQMILADEPTGALDSENSVKIMELLKKIAKDRLVITVTHNDELAKTYATRTIKMKDGEIVSDDAPFKAPVEGEVVSEDKQKNSFMPYSLATKLSLKNLAGKKIRSLLTSIASSIAIIGIALVLACSNGLNFFIEKVQKDTMSSIPITVSSKEVNIAPIIDGVLGQVGSTATGENKKPVTDSIFINHTLKNLVVEEITNEISQHFIDYLKGLDSNRVRYDAVKNVTRNVYKKVLMPVYGNDTHKVVNVLNTMGSWACLPPERDILEEQYTLVAGKYPENYTDLLLVVDKNYSIGDTQLLNYLVDIDAMDESKTSYTYDEILNDPLVRQYNLILNDDYYGTETFSTNKSVDLATFIRSQYRQEIPVSVIKESILKSNAFIASIYDKIKCYNAPVDDADAKAIKLNIVGIVKLNDDTQYGMLSAPIAYTRALDEEIIRLANESAIVKAQKASPSNKVLGGGKISSNKDYINVLATLGYTELPTNIKFYPRTIADKDYLLDYLDAYNEINKDNEDLPKITYTDHVGAVVGVVRLVVGSVSAILIALTSVSLIVSAIMVGIITYVSVIERTKEIGVLRSVGARKKDVVRLFITETGIIGFVAGIVGVLLTIVLMIPLNVLMQNLTGVAGFVFLNWWNFIAIILGSALLTIIAGLIPSLLASKKDPVKALRSE